MRKKWLIIAILAAIGTAAVILVCTFFGAADITIKDTLMILANKTFGVFDQEIEALGAKTTIIWKMRLCKNAAGSTRMHFVA